MSNSKPDTPFNEALKRMMKAQPKPHQDMKQNLEKKSDMDSKKKTTSPK